MIHDERRQGFYHEEAVPHDAGTVEMLQLFLRPRKNGLTPNVQFYKFPEAVPENSWRLIAGKETSDAPLKINSEVNIFDARLKASSLSTPAIQDPKIGFLYVFEGQA